MRFLRFFPGDAFFGASKVTQHESYRVLRAEIYSRTLHLMWCFTHAAWIECLSGHVENEVEVDRYKLCSKRQEIAHLPCQTSEAHQSMANTERQHEIGGGLFEQHNLQCFISSWLYNGSCSCSDDARLFINQWWCWWTETIQQKLTKLAKYCPRKAEIAPQSIYISRPHTVSGFALAGHRASHLLGFALRGNIFRFFVKVQSYPWFYKKLW